MIHKYILLFNFFFFSNVVAGKLGIINLSNTWNSWFFTRVILLCLFYIFSINCIHCKPFKIQIMLQ